MKSCKKGFALDHAMTYLEVGLQTSVQLIPKPTSAGKSLMRKSELAAHKEEVKLSIQMAIGCSNGFVQTRRWTKRIQH